MSKKKQGLTKRWFIEAPLYQLVNGEEIRQAARKEGVRLVDARYKSEFDAEAPGKPAEVLHDRYKKQGGSSDSNRPAPKPPEGQEPLGKAEDAQAKAQAAAAVKAAAAAKAAQAKAEAQATKAAEAKADADEKAVE